MNRKQFQMTQHSYRVTSNATQYFRSRAAAGRAPRTTIRTMFDHTLLNTNYKTPLPRVIRVQWEINSDNIIYSDPNDPRYDGVFVI